MDTGILLNMLNGNAAANKPAASADSSVNSKSSSEHSDVKAQDFPAMVDTVSAAKSSQTAVEGKELQTLSINIKSQGLMQPKGAQNVLIQGVVLLEPATVENIVAQNKALANKLDSLVAAGDLEGYAAIMQNIKAIVEQVNLISLI